MQAARPAAATRALRAPSSREEASAREEASVRQEGSGVVDFLLVSVLLLFLFLAVVQVGLVLHTRNVLVAAAAEGARYGANADRTPEQGAARTQEFVADALSARTAQALRVVPSTPLSPEGLRTVQIEVTSPLPVVLLPVGPLSITVRGHALREGT